MSGPFHDDEIVDISMECPGCDAAIKYEDWEIIDGLEGACQCPQCGYLAREDELFE